MTTDMLQTPSSDVHSDGPINAIVPLADDLFVVDGAPIKFPGLAFPTRMTIVRLADGALWLHSPIAFSADLARAVRALGPVKYLIAPNIYHHLYLQAWQDEFPQAQMFAAPGLIEKRKDLIFAGELDDDVAGTAARPWQDELSCVIFRGNRLMAEAVFLHRPSRTAILTDLILNMRVEHLPLLGRWFFRFDQVAYPNGGTPRLFRWSMKDRVVARATILQVLAWAPERVVISHGEIVHTDGADFLKARFAWLTD